VFADVKIHPSPHPFAYLEKYNNSISLEYEEEINFGTTLSFPMAQICVKTSGKRSTLDEINYEEKLLSKTLAPK
jgi:hypothetical protein